MARGVNKVILIGNLCADPEVRAMPNGNQVTNVTIATNESWNDKNTGQKQERAEFHRVVFFGKLAEIAGQYLKKGASVYVEGTLRTRKWQDKEGQDRYTTEIVCDMNGQMQMLGGGDGNQSYKSDSSTMGKPPQSKPTQSQGQNPNGTQKSPYAGQAPQGFDDFDDDIPFN